MSYTIKDISSMVADEDLAPLTDGVRGARYSSRVVSNSFQVIPISSKFDQKTTRAVHRVNAFGSLYYFLTVILKKNKFQTNPDLSKNLHFQMCKAVEKDGIQDVVEIPRDHFKTTTYSEGFPMWRSLRFSAEDEQLLRALGGPYGTDEFIAWMKRAHRQDFRWLIASEVIKNAVKIGTRISGHYISNHIFRHIFNDVIPDAGGTWNNESLHHKRSDSGSVQGEGTYDFIGVGGALQSRHYDGIIQDDLVGKTAIESEIEMEKTIEYHKLLVGAFDSEADSSGRENDELIVGNRWAWNDLNSWVRANETYFNFTTHSALGGCCKLHPYGTSIFPEAFSIEKLEKWKKRLGTYHFSCQFLNMPINPAELKLNKKDLRYYEFVSCNEDNAVITHKKKRIAIRHHVHEGDVIADVMPRTLRRYMIVDPNHAEQKGRCRHAITVTGVMDDPRRIYLLDVWAKASSIEQFINVIFIMAKQWKLDEIYLETIAAQRYLKYHLEYRQAVADGDDSYIKNFTFKELETPRTANAKKMRIESLIPIIERHELWVNSYGQQEFMEEVESYPNGTLKDVLDTLGYGPQVWDFEPTEEEIEGFLNDGLLKWERQTKPEDLVGA
jgi:hypothetical protein